MPTCVDKDKFNLADHGHDAGVALKQLMKVPAITNGALGDVIELIRLAVLPMCEFTWIPLSDKNAGSAAGFFRVDNDAPNRIQLKSVRVNVMENKRSQVVHELVHALDMAYYFFNISHPPTAAGLAKRVPVLYLFPIGDVFKYNFMDQPFIDDAFIANHTGILTYCAGMVRNNSLLNQDQRDMLMTQLNYAARGDKVHVEFTANIAQCLALIYQWGFTGNEKGALGRPRSIAMVIRRMESALRAAIQEWRTYVPPARKVGSVIQFTVGDKRQPALDEGHFEKTDWWKTMVPKPPGF